MSIHFYILRAKADKSDIWTIYNCIKIFLAIASEEKTLWIVFFLVLKLLSSKINTFESEKIKLPALFLTLWKFVLYWSVSNPLQKLFRLLPVVILVGLMESLCFEECSRSYSPYFKKRSLSAWWVDVDFPAWHLRSQAQPEPPLCPHCVGTKTSAYISSQQLWYGVFPDFSSYLGL